MGVTGLGSFTGGVSGSGLAGGGSFGGLISGGFFSGDGGGSSWKIMLLNTLWFRFIIYLS